MKAYDIKRGNVVEHNGTTYQVRAVERSAPTGRGGNTTYRFQLYSVPGGVKLDLSLRADDELPEVDLTRRTATFSYREGDNFVFMDAEDYTQYLLGPEIVGELAGYITEGMEDCQVMLKDDAPISLQLPQHDAGGGRNRAGTEGRDRHQAAQARQAGDRHRDPGAGVHRQRREDPHQHRDRRVRRPRLRASRSPA